MKTTLKLLYFLLLLSACSEHGKEKLELNFPKNGTQLRTNSNFNLKFQKNFSIDFDSIEVILDGNKITAINKLSDSVFIPKTKIGYTTLRFKVWNSNVSVLEKDLQVLLLSKLQEKNFSYKIMEVIGHNIDDYTQGLEIDNGFLYEGTGLYGKSKLKKYPLNNDGSTNAVELDETYFGEGITILKDKVYQLTWQERKAFVYDKKNLQKILEFDYPINMEGWGLTNDGAKLYASTGTNEIYVLNPENFQIENTLHILNYEGVKLKNLNELEYADGFIYANVYQANHILKIDALTGEVVAKIDMEGLLKKSDYGPETDVLNGIAYDKDQQTFLVTGKNWPKLFRVVFEEKK